MPKTAQRNWTSAEVNTLRALWSEYDHLGPAKRAGVIGVKLNRSWGSVYQKALYERLHRSFSQRQPEAPARPLHPLQRWWNDVTQQTRG